MNAKRAVVLLILDGWGIGEDDAHNSIFLANTPNIDHLLATYPNGAIGAAGEHIGLNPGHQGSTEMGHLIISAGRNVMLPQMIIQQSLESAEFKNNPAYMAGIKKAKENGTRLHLIGLLSDAGVHSYDACLHTLLEMAAEHGLKQDQVLIHIFADGRDTPPRSLSVFVERLQEQMKSAGVGTIASVMGRWWVMDRDHRWERIEESHRMLTQGIGKRTADSIEQAIEAARKQDEDDEFIQPTMIEPNGFFKDDDVVINFNYRVDREIEITQALIDQGFEPFIREVQPQIHYVATFPYYENMNAPYAFERRETEMKNTLGEVLANNNLTQFRVTETEKWAYLTKVFNAMRETAFPGEDRHLIPSDKIATFDLKPEMQAVPIAEQIAEKLRERKHDVIIANICNADMVGHTGNKEAAIIGCEAIDKGMGLIYEELQKQHAIMCITADHGDAEVMWDEKHEVPHTYHTDSFVPFILVDDEQKSAKIRETGALRDVAPTVLHLLGIDIPEDMNGQSLILPATE